LQHSWCDNRPSNYHLPLHWFPFPIILSIFQEVEREKDEKSEAMKAFKKKTQQQKSEKSKKEKHKQKG